MPKPLRIFPCALALLWIASRLPYFEPYHFEWDSTQFTLGFYDYDPAAHQPHPPGYPLWILAMHAVAPLTGHPATAQTLLGWLFLLAAIPPFYLMLRERSGPAAALVTTAAVWFSPLVLLHASVQSVYPVDLFASAWLGYSCARILAGEPRFLVHMAVLAPLTMGIRQSGVVFLGLLIGLAVFEVVLAKKWRILTISAATGLVFLLAWLIPLAEICGGFDRLKQLNQGQFLLNARLTSWFLGAHWYTHAVMLTRGAAVLLAGLAPLALAVVVTLRKSARTNSTCPSPAWDRWWFYLLWALPCVAFNLLIHGAKPGYWLLALPPLALWLTRNFRPDARVWVPLAVALVAAVGLPRLIPSPNLPGPWPYLFRVFCIHLEETVPITADRVLDSWRALSAEFGPDGSKVRDDLVVCIRDLPSAPNRRTLIADFPELRMVTFDHAARPVVIHRRQATPLDRIPVGVERLWWVTDGQPLPEQMKTALPYTQGRLGLPSLILWRSPVGSRPLDVRLRYAGMDIRLAR